MAETGRYRRPDIPRPVLVNPAHKESNDATELESEIVRIHQERRPLQEPGFRAL